MRGRTREDDLAVEIENLMGERRELVKNIGRLTDGYDCVSLDDDPTVAEDSGVGVHGDDGGIVKYSYCN